MVEELPSPRSKTAISTTYDLGYKSCHFIISGLKRFTELGGRGQSYLRSNSRRKPQSECSVVPALTPSIAGCPITSPSDMSKPKQSPETVETPSDSTLKLSCWRQRGPSGCHRQQEGTGDVAVAALVHVCSGWESGPPSYSRFPECPGK